MRILASLVLAGIVLAPAARAASPAAWPQFRGPNGAGIADDATLPVSWSTTEHVAWTADLPGRGWSSPIVWGDRVFVTSAVNTNAFKAPGKGIFGNDYAAELEKQGLVRGRDRQEAGGARHRAGQRVGRRSATSSPRSTRRPARWCGSARRTADRRPAAAIARTRMRPRRRPPTASGSTRRSAATSACSATRLDGTLLWSRTWPPQPIYLDFGTASSPVVHGGRVYQLHDNDGESFFAALDAKTGKDIWTRQADRPRFTPRLRMGDAARSGRTTSAPRSSPSAAAS